MSAEHLPPPAVEGHRPATGGTPGGTGRLSRTQRRNDILDRFGAEWRLVPVILALLALWVFFSSQSSVFLTPRNLTNLVNQIAETSLFALGLIFVLIVRQIDLSVAALSAVCAVVSARLAVDHDVSVAVAIAGGAAFGGLIGVIQGSIVTVSGAPAFIVTLGGSLILEAVLYGLLPQATGQIGITGSSLEGVANSYLSTPAGYALAIAGSAVFLGLRVHTHRARTVRDLHSNVLSTVILPVAAVAGLAVAAVATFSSYRGVPTPACIVMVVLAVCAFATTQTRFGTYLYAIGGNPEAARRAGIPIRRMILAAFVLVGVFAALGGIVNASRVLGVSQQSGSTQVLLEAIAAAVIGGASLFGGRGSVWAALIGALVIGTVANGLLLMDATFQAQLAVQGGILVFAVVTDAVLTKRAGPRQ